MKSRSKVKCWKKTLKHKYHASSQHIYLEGKDGWMDKWMEKVLLYLPSTFVEKLFNWKVAPVTASWAETFVLSHGISTSVQQFSGQTSVDQYRKCDKVIHDKLNRFKSYLIQVYIQNILKALKLALCCSNILNWYILHVLHNSESFPFATHVSLICLQYSTHHYNTGIH